MNVAKAKTHETWILKRKLSPHPSPLLLVLIPSSSPPPHPFIISSSSPRPPLLLLILLPSPSSTAVYTSINWYAMCTRPMLASQGQGWFWYPRLRTMIQWICNLAGITTCTMEQSYRITRKILLLCVQLHLWPTSQLCNNFH